MSILYLGSSIATSVVCLFGLSVASLSAVSWRSIGQLSFCGVFFLADFHCRRKMESTRTVLGNPGDGRSGVSICNVVHVMKAACKYVEVLLPFAC